jgi:putative transposase
MYGLMRDYVIIYAPAGAFFRFTFVRQGVVDEFRPQECQIAKERTIPRRTLTRWVKQYRETGLDGLIRQGHADKGERRYRPPDLKSLIEGLALQKPRRSAAAIHRQVTRVATEQGWPVPSYSQVYAIIDALDPGLVVLAHQGSKAYREHFDLLYRFEAEAPNHLWQAGHTFLPVFLLIERGKPDRPWLSDILDDYSRAIAGMVTKEVVEAAREQLVIGQV